MGQPALDSAGRTDLSVCRDATAPGRQAGLQDKLHGQGSPWKTNAGCSRKPAKARPAWADSLRPLRRRGRCPLIQDARTPASVRAPSAWGPGSGRWTKGAQRADPDAPYAKGTVIVSAPGKTATPASPAQQAPGVRAGGAPEDAPVFGAGWGWGMPATPAISTPPHLPLQGNQKSLPQHEPLQPQELSLHPSEVHPGTGNPTEDVACCDVALGLYPPGMTRPAHPAPDASQMS